MNFIKRLFDLLPFGIIFYTRKIPFGEKRHEYQSRFVNFDINKGDKILDIGCGGYPFPYATQLVDKFPEDTHHRYEDLKKLGIPFVEASVENLPFEDKSFDYVYCSHVLEHVEEPEKAIKEIQRVGKKGYIEVPTKMSDTLFNYTRLEHFHKWYINIVGNKMIFIEYNDKEQRDTNFKELFFMAHSLFTNNFKRFFKRNRDLFSNLFVWEGEIEFIIINKEGEIIAQS